MDASSREEPAEEEEQVALAVALSRQRKNQQKEAGKASIAKGAQPLKVKPPEPAAPAGRVFRQAWRRTAGELSEVEQRTAVLQALEVFLQLPPSSSYAQHRIKVLQTALALLDKEAGERSVEERDELQQLLSQLKI